MCTLLRQAGAQDPNFFEPFQSEIRRNYLPCTPVNRGRQAKGRGAILMELSLSSRVQQTFNPGFAPI
jgi:hypothetical protein